MKKRGILLKNKIAFSVILIISFVIWITNGILSTGYSRQLEESNRTQTQQMVEQLANYYNEKLTNLLNLMHTTIENDSFQYSLDETLWNEEFSYAKELSVMQGLFHQIMFRERIVESILLHTPRVNYIDSLHVLIGRERMEMSAVYAAMGEGNAIYWGTASHDEIFRGGNIVIPVMLRISAPYQQEKSFFIVNILEKNFIREMESVHSESKVSVFVFNGLGQLVTGAYDSDREYSYLYEDESLLKRLESETALNYRYQGRTLYMNRADIAINNWTVITVQDADILMDNVKQLKGRTLLIGMLAMLLAGITAYYISNSMTKPIYQVSKTMKEIETGDLGVRYVQSKTSREIDELGEGLNHMLDTIERLIQNLEEEKIKTEEESRQKVKATLNALQSQINSHFLYNTLDSIYWKSKLAGNEVVSEMIISLSNLLRISLSKGWDIIPLEMEIEHVKNFLYLQTAVYPGRFTYSFEVGEDLKGYRTPKLILQPLVENAIVHGFDGIDYLGEIRVKVFKSREIDGERIHFVVWDNGVGFDASKVMEHVEMFDSNTSGYALKNIYRRLKLKLGDDAVLRMESAGRGSSTIEIVIRAVSG